MKNVGFIGWRGMVGSVLIDQMKANNDFDSFYSHFFSSSQAGEPSPFNFSDNKELLNASSIPELSKMDFILSCQGGDYTKEIYPQLRASGWSGYWIDAASTLRMSNDSQIVLDPINHEGILQAHANGVKNFIGGNCTVSLLLLAIGGLIKKDLVEWVSSMTYQAASGAGAAAMRELLAQMQFIGQKNSAEISDSSFPILELDSQVNALLNSDQFPCKQTLAPLAGSLLPWIDSEVEQGQSREEWKAMAEANKILGFPEGQLKIDGTCVRVGSMRCHAQALTIKLKKDLPIEELEDIISNSHQWVELVPNNKAETLKKLTPAYASGKLCIPIGRIRKMSLDGFKGQYINAFTLGDQLLWGAAEPLRRALQILIELT